MKTNGGRSPEQILAEVEIVRSEMNSTLSELERKLTPGQLLDQGLDYLRTSGASQFVSNLGTSVKENPMPVTLVGIGLAWLMATNRSYTAGYRSEPSPMAGPSTEEVRSMASSVGRRIGDSASQAASSARETMGQAGQTLVDAAQTARERFGQARRRITDTAYSARDTLMRGADTAKLQLERARSGYDWMVREQPLALGAIGLAIGALLAAAAPRTRTENDLMGETSDRLAERAKEAGREQLETAAQKVKEVVEPFVAETQQAPKAEGT